MSWMFWQRASWVAAAIGWPSYFVVQLVKVLL